jgi:hypothetical protein
MTPVIITTQTVHLLTVTDADTNTDIGIVVCDRRRVNGALGWESCTAHALHMGTVHVVAEGVGRAEAIAEIVAAHAVLHERGHHATA